MAKGLTMETAMLWRHIAKDRGWWNVLRLTRAWAPTFSLAEVEEHLVTLKTGGFLEAKQHLTAGTVYAFTEACIPLPGESATPETVPPPAPPRRPDAMGSHYRSPQPVYRAGALDHIKCPSLQLGKRVPHPSTH